MIALKLRDVLDAYEKRTGKRLTYAELAQRTGLSRATVEALASRPSYNTTLATINTLCETLDCALTDLVEYRPSKRHLKRRSRTKATKRD